MEMKKDSMTYPDDYINKVICGDCLEAMQGIPDGSIDLVLTDPPWNVGKNYGNESDKQEEKQYLEWIYRVQKEARRIVKDDGLSLWFFPIKYLPLIYNQFKDWDYIWTACWIAPNRRSMSTIGYNLWQPILIYGNKRWLKNQDVYFYPTGQEIFNHPTPKPEKLMVKLVGDFSKKEDIILDPFLGSGTTAVACKRLDRRFIGAEINPEYCKIAEKRLANTLYNEELDLKGGG